MIPRKSKNQRVAYLDGLRGVAAFAVLFHHFVLGYQPKVSPTFLHGVFHGSFAVGIFFVLSGFVMSAASDGRNEPFLLRCAKRYLRLALPMLAAVVVAWVLLGLFPAATRELTQITHSPWTNAHYVDGTVPFWYVPVDGLIRPFIRQNSYLDSSLWTMQPEFIGSLGIFVVYAALPDRHRLVGAAALAAIAVFSHQYWGVCFAAGIAFWELKLQNAKLPWAIGPAAVCAGWLLSIVSEPLLSQMPPRTNPWPLYVCASILMVGGLLVWDQLKVALEMRFPQFLGRISFGLYLIHLPLLLTALAALWVRWQPAGLEIGLFLALYVALALAGGWAMTKIADEPTLRLLKRLRVKTAKPVTPIASTAP
jgi:peptidoglycan/LPS O-acetylase OafA/YrhL